MERRGWNFVVYELPYGRRLRRDLAIISVVYPKQFSRKGIINAFSNFLRSSYFF